jgi:hypothetical protein
VHNKAFRHLNIVKNKACARGKQTSLNVIVHRLSNKSNDAKSPLLNTEFVKKYIILNSH